MAPQTSILPQLHGSPDRQAPSPPRALSGTAAAFEHASPTLLPPPPADDRRLTLPPPWSPGGNTADAVIDVSEEDDPRAFAYETYQDLMKGSPSLGEKHYAEVPLMNLSSKARGDAVERMVRHQDELTNTNAEFDYAEPTARTNGVLVGSNSTKYDYARIEHNKITGVSGKITYVEVKCARITWAPKKKSWKAAFGGIKPDCHDELRLALFLNNCIHVFVYSGKVDKYGTKAWTKKENGPVAAGKAILANMTRDCSRYIGRIAFNDEKYKEFFEHTTETIKAYKGKPLADLDPSSRGKLLEEVARRQDNLLNPDCNFVDPPTRDRKGKKRGRSSAECDYVRVGDGKRVRVEVKSAQFSFNKSVERWAFTFENIKDELHDELRLVFYLPDGLHIIVHDPVSDTGKICVQSPRTTPGWRKAVGDISNNIKSGVYGTHIGWIPFPNESSRP